MADIGACAQPYSNQRSQLAAAQHESFTQMAAHLLAQYPWLLQYEQSSYQSEQADCRQARQPRQLQSHKEKEGKGTCAWNQGRHKAGCVAEGKLDVETHSSQRGA
jgi:hypothetical protein